MTWSSWHRSLFCLTHCCSSGTELSFGWFQRDSKLKTASASLLRANCQVVVRRLCLALASSSVETPNTKRRRSQATQLVLPSGPSSWVDLTSQQYKNKAWCDEPRRARLGVSAAVMVWWMRLKLWTRVCSPSLYALELFGCVLCSTTTTHIFREKKILNAWSIKRSLFVKSFHWWM